jgi:acyl dehydratase
MNQINNTYPCLRCGEPVELGKSVMVRLTNVGKPNSDSDKWGHQHMECTTQDQKDEMSGKKYFGYEIGNG